MRDEEKTRADLIAELRTLRRRLAGRSPGSPPGDDPYEHLLENMRAMVCELDAEGRLIYVSRTVSDLLGYAPEEVVGTSGLEWTHDKDLPEVSKRFQESIASGHVARYLYRARHKSGHWVWLEGSGSIYRTAEGEPRVVAFSRDVTEARRAEEARRAGEERLQVMIDNASDFMAELDAEGHFLFVSSNCMRLFGHPPEFFIGKKLQDLALVDTVHPDDQNNLRTGYDANVMRRGRAQIETRMKSADGSWHWFESTAKTYQARDGSMRAVVISRDVTERHQAEQELYESEVRYRQVIDASGNLVSEVDAEGRLVYMSPSVERILGYRPEELVGTTPFSLVHPDDMERAVESFLRGVAGEETTRTNVYRVRHKDGSYRWFGGEGIPYETADGELRFLGVNYDVTEQRATLALLDLPPESPARARIQMIQKAAHRAAALTNQMLAYTGNETLQLEVLDLSRLVEEMAQLVESAVSKKAELSYELLADPPPVEADAAQLSQVAMNLITNAAEALGDDVGRISIRTGVTEADRALLSRTLLGAELPEGTYAFFEVVDTGSGMDSDTRSKIFDPFFTTKFTGRGLGLAAVLGIVRSHGGAIELDSVPGLGTRFRVLLPKSSRAYTPRADDDTRVGAWRSKGTILIVDDDAGVRELARETLERAGLDVITANDGREAVTRFAENADSIRLVLLDRTMPASGGEEAFVRIREIEPRVPIVLVSGYARASLNGLLSEPGLAGFLQKPFLPTALLAKVRELLDR
jgi:PAS domain S-box-containing protein